MRIAGGLILALGLAAGLGGCMSVAPPDSGDALVATLGQAGGQVVLRPDQQLLVRLYLDEGTGLVWRVGKSDHLIRINKAESIAGRLGRPLPPSVGHGGVVQTFSFRAEGRGEGELTFVLRPSRDDYAPAPTDRDLHRPRAVAVTVLDHISISASDLGRSKAFYDAALAPLGIEVLWPSDPDAIAYGYGETGTRRPYFWLAEGGVTTGRLHVAFTAQTRAAVDAFYRAALAAGGRDNGPPGLRVQYHPGYYGAFVFDPDGLNIEAVCHIPE